MKNKTIAILAPFFLFIFLFIYTQTQKESITEETIPVLTQTGIKEGQSAPDFELKTQDGKSIKLSDYRGQKVLLNFWASWCPPCKKEIPDLNEFYGEHSMEKITVLSVNMTYSEKNKQIIQAFQDMYKIRYPVLLDQTGTIAGLYKIITIPTSYFIDSNGIIQKRIIGPLQKETIKNLMETID
ncbi:peroxiredoxin [Bacillus sp. D386]|uniref:peroxiredoxin family protein n=1 Tax=Bacillus sp. D386 TaxID=2587155 RepID=UPI00111D6DC2|nr:TlpA disulfide reductase family protein [Bacillus sp. D386]